MPEFPVILSHNVLDDALITGSDIVGHELKRMRDGHRHTWWQAPGTGLQAIDIRPRNLADNSNFDIDLHGWVALGAGVATFEHNTTAPIVGDGDALLTATTADASANVVVATQIQPIFMAANTTYRIMIRALVQDAAPKNIRLGFLEEGLTEDAAFYDVVQIQTTDNGHHVDITPTADAWFHPYIRAIEPQTLQFDDVVVGEVRDVDTLIIDAGHTLLLATISIRHRDNEKITYSVVGSPSSTQWTNNSPIYITFDPVKSLSWKIQITAFPIPQIPVAKIPLMYLGKRWTLPHHFSGSFDPDQKERFDDMTIGDRGVAQRSLKYNQRKFVASLAAIDQTTNLDVQKFFDDTDNAAKPFFFIWKPETNLKDILCMRLETSKNVPYQNGAQRRWEFDALELAGRREI